MVRFGRVNQEVAHWAVGVVRDECRRHACGCEHSIGSVATVLRGAPDKHILRIAKYEKRI
eukprot:5889445-Pyramimonas_sp.AAC.2